MGNSTLLGIDTTILRSGERQVLAANFWTRPEIVTKLAARYLVTYLEECRHAYKDAGITASNTDPHDSTISLIEPLSRIMFDLKSLNAGRKEIVQLMIDILEAGLPAPKNAWLHTLARQILLAHLKDYAKQKPESERNLFPDIPEVKACGIYAYDFVTNMGYRHPRFAAWVEFQNGERFSVRRAADDLLAGKDTGWDTRARAYYHLYQFIRFRLNRNLPAFNVANSPVESMKALSDYVRVVFMRN
jgi:hypothetical protein